MGMPYDLIWLAVPLYVVLQVVALKRPGSRVAGAVPLAVMVPVFVATVVGIVQQSNLWPLLLLMASPVAVLYLTVVLLTGRRAGVPHAG